MRLLLDTHAFLRGLEASERLSARARAAIHDTASHKFVSHASLWEITIKAAPGKLRLFEPWGETLRQIERRVPRTVLPFTAAHLEKLFELPHRQRAHCRSIPTHPPAVNRRDARF